MTDEIGSFDDRLSELETSIATAEAMTASFRAEMEDVSISLQGASQSATSLSRSLSTSLRNAVTDLIFDGARLSDVLREVGRSLTGSVLDAALKPLTNAVSGAITGGIGGLFGGAFANGGVMSQGRVQAFANGGVINGPTTFPMRGGRVGLMGEAGPEAIMPLTRGADGRLGVQGGGGQTVNVTMNIQTPDAQSFTRSRSQVAAQVSRALSRSNRNL